MEKILIIDDSIEDVESIRACFPEWECDAVGDIETARRCLERTRHDPYRLVILDLRIWKSGHAEPSIETAPLTDMNGMETLKEFLNMNYPAACTVLSGYTMDEEIRNEFSTLLQPYPFQIDLLPKEYVLDCPEELSTALWRATVVITPDERQQLEGAGIFWGGKTFEHCLRCAKVLAQDDGPVLITGPSGAGKSMLVKAIHIFRGQPTAPFVEKNMAELLAAGGSGDARAIELFGCAPRTYRGFPQGYEGVFERASGYNEGKDRSQDESLCEDLAGVAFIDEIHHLSIPLQAALLRVIQERVVQRLGSDSARPHETRVNCKMVFGTREDPWKLSKTTDPVSGQPRFLPDLLYRIGGEYSHVHLPGLAERRKDVVPILMGMIERELSKRAIEAEIKIHPFVQDYLTNVAPLERNARDLCDVVRKVVTEETHRTLSKQVRRWLTVRHITDIIPRHSQISSPEQLWSAIQGGEGAGSLREICKRIGYSGLVQLAKLIMRHINPPSIPANRRRWPTKQEIDRWFPGMTKANWIKMIANSVCRTSGEALTRTEAKAWLCEES